MKQLLPLLLFVFVLSGCARKLPAGDPVPEHQSFTIPSVKVNEDRVINVWLPNEYATGELSYPVLYMPDGGVKEDFPHIANTLAALIEARQVPPMILVGIENTVRGRDLTGASDAPNDAKYCPVTDGASDFRAFITEELMPEIDGKYRTTGYKAIIGESLAGLFVMETFLQHPKTFDTYIAFDPSLWWNDHFLVANSPQLLNDHPETPINLWFAGSGAEDISEYTRMLSRTLVEVAPQNLRWTYSDEPGEKHSTIFRATKEKAMIWAFQDLK